MASMITVRVLVAVLPQVSMATCVVLMTESSERRFRLS
jgi:hypothetical protein